jgi:hypothetical protein
MAKVDRSRKAKPEPKPVAPRPPFVPHPRDAELIERMKARERDDAMPAPLKHVNGSLTYEARNTDEADVMTARFLNTFGTGNHRVANLLMNQLANLKMTPDRSAVDPEALTGLMSCVSAYQPADEVEAQIAVLAVGMQHATMDALRRAQLPDQGFEARNANIGHANKCARTFATLVETLNRHRGKGQQKVTVEHVHVHEGGQAIVGAVTHAPGEGRRET